MGPVLIVSVIVLAAGGYYFYEKEDPKILALLAGFLVCVVLVLRSM